MRSDLSREDKAQLGDLVEEMRTTPGFKKVKYLGKGRYKVYVDKQCVPDERFYFLSKQIDYFSIQPQQNGAIIIKGAQIRRNDIEQLKSIGVQIRGRLTVRVKKGVRVIKHNADKEPRFFGLFGDYEWEIRSFETAPFIVVQPSM
jgi:hypothetical protein